MGTVVYGKGRYHSSITVVSGSQYSQMSALREISLVNEIRAVGVSGMEYLYMGTYTSFRRRRYDERSIVLDRLLHPLMSKDAIQRRVCALVSS